MSHLDTKINRYGGGTYNEFDTLVSPVKPVGPLKPVLFLHGLGASHTQGVPDVTNPEAPRLVRDIARAGHLVCCADAGGLSPWGNTTAQNRIAALINYALSLTPSFSKVALIGYSMGNANAFAVANIAATTGKINAIAGVMPVSDTADIHANNRGGATAGMNAAFGGNWSTGGGPAQNPLNLAPNIASKGIKYRAYYAGADDIVIPSTVTTLVNTYGALASAVNLGNVGHVDSTLALINRPDLLGFLAEAGWN